MRVNAESHPALSRFRKRWPEKRPFITNEAARLFREGDRLLDDRIGASDLITQGTSNHPVVGGDGLAPC
jgi:hypothetical protein